MTTTPIVIDGLLQVHVSDRRDDMAAELARLRAENKRLKALLREASGHVAPDTGWSYDEPTGYLLDRIDAAMAQGKV